MSFRKITDGVKKPLIENVLLKSQLPSRQVAGGEGFDISFVKQLLALKAKAILFPGKELFLVLGMRSALRCNVATLFSLHQNKHRYYVHSGLFHVIIFWGEVLLKVMYFLGFSWTCVCSLGVKLQISPAGFNRLKIIFLSSELYSANIPHEGAVHPGYSVKLKLGICKTHLWNRSHQDTRGERQVSAHEHY